MRTRCALVEFSGANQLHKFGASWTQVGPVGVDEVVQARVMSADQHSAGRSRRRRTTSPTWHGASPATRSRLNDSSKPTQVPMPGLGRVLDAGWGLVEVTKPVAQSITSGLETNVDQ